MVAEMCVWCRLARKTCGTQIASKTSDYVDNPRREAINQYAIELAVDRQ